MRPRDRRLVDLLSAPHQVAVLAPTPYRSERPAKRPSKGIDHPTPVTEGWARREARAHVVSKIRPRRWASLRAAHPTTPTTAQLRRVGKARSACPPRQKNPGSAVGFAPLSLPYGAGQAISPRSVRRKAWLAVFAICC